MVVYDADNHVLGRMCTTIAKQLLDGEKVFVINAEKVVISGNPKVILDGYLQKIHRGEQHGPYFPKQPEEIFRRTVRGMLPIDRTRGRTAFRNLRVFVGIPDELKGKQAETIKTADAKKLRCKSMKLGDLAFQIGAKKRW